MAVSPLRLLYLGHSELAVRTVSLELHLVTDLVLAGALLIAPGGNARAVFLSPGLSRIDGLSAIEFVQDKQKSRDRKTESEADMAEPRKLRPHLQSRSS